MTALTSSSEISDPLPRAVGVSVAALIARHAVTKLIGIAGMVILAHLLYPADFGVFALASILIGGVMMVNDLGLGSSLVQQPAEPTPDELRAIFTFQQCIVLVAAGAIVILAPVVGAIYHLGPSAVWLTRFLGLYLLATSFRWIPEVLLTRHVRFAPMALVEVITAIVYQAVTLGGALAGLRYWALGLGLTVYAVSNALLINRLAPWPIGLRWDWTLVRAHLRFGVPYQGTVLVAALETAAGPVLLGLLAGAAVVGYAGFALSIVNFGLMIPILILQVGFPAMSRIQQARVRLGRALELALTINSYLICAAYLPLLLFAGPIVRVLFGDRWLPAVPLLLLLLWWGILRSLLTMAATALNAMGNSTLNFWLHLAPAVSSWILIVLLVPGRGLAGFGQALLISAIPLPLALVYLRRLLPLRLTVLVRPLGLFLAAYALGTLERLLVNVEASLFNLGLSVVIVIGGYGLAACLLERKHIPTIVAAARRYLAITRNPPARAVQPA